MLKPGVASESIFFSASVLQITVSISFVMLWNKDQNLLPFHVRDFNINYKCSEIYIYLYKMSVFQIISILLVSVVKSSSPS